MWKGYNTILGQNDLYNILDEDKTENLADKLEK